MGRGTRTNIYLGRLKVKGEGNGNEDDKCNNNSANCREIQVVLKSLDESHKDIALVSLVVFALTVTNTQKKKYGTLSTFLPYVFFRRFLKLRVS